MPRYSLLPAASLAFVLLLSCHSQRQHHPIPAFYYWKTTFPAGNTAQPTMDSLGSHKMYLRLFDVDLDPNTGAAQPQAILQLAKALHPEVEYVPVVFLTQPVLQHANKASIQSLAERIATLIARLCQNAGIQPREIQIDYDWTAPHRDAYFLLLSALKLQPFFQQKMLSCTIRLHQVKYWLKSGIPPVDKGMLMCYNIGDLKQPNARNSILDPALAKDYLKHLHAYPLPLDVALPLFDWCVLFRNGIYAGIIRDAMPEELATDACFAHLNDQLYEVRRDTLWHGYMLQRGDRIRGEATTMADLQAIADFTSAQLKADTFTLAFFHLDSTIILHHPIHEIKTILDAYR